MKELIHPLTRWPSWLVVLGVAIWAIYNGIYGDLNPQHLQLVDAAVWILTYLLGLVGIAKYVIAAMQKMLLETTRSMPVVDPPPTTYRSPDDPRYH